MSDIREFEEYSDRLHEWMEDDISPVYKRLSKGIAESLRALRDAGTDVPWKDPARRKNEA